MAHRFKNIDRDTPMLLPPDLRDWVAEDDLVHFIIGAVERLPLSRPSPSITRAAATSNRAERDSLPKAARRAGAEAPGNSRRT